MFSSGTLIKEWESMAISSWADLPQELLHMIKNCIESPIDVSRFRSVCSTWRSSTPSFKTFSEALLFKNFSPFKENDNVCHLNPKMIYRVEPLNQSSSSLSYWLIAMEFIGDKCYFVNPLTGFQIKTRHPELPKELNLCDFRFTELKKVLNVENCSVFRGVSKLSKIKKSLLIYPPQYIETMLAVLDFSGNLVFYKCGVDQWISLKEFGGTMYFLDIELHRGRICGVRSSGRTVVFDSDLNANEIAPPASHEQQITWDSYLIESCGDVHLVQMLNRYYGQCYLNSISFVWEWIRLLDNGLLDINVYKLQEDEQNWDKMSHLGDRVFFISCGFGWSFSASSEEFSGCKGNRIVFICETESMGGNSYKSPSNDVGVFDMETGKMEHLDRCPEYGEVYWPPPKWLKVPNV